MTEFLPSEFFLAQNYPNPFREKTIIKYCIAYKTRVKLIVYNSKGELVKTLVDEEKKPGAYDIEFLVETHRDASLRNETLYYRLEAGKFNSEKTMTLSK